MSPPRYHIKHNINKQLWVISNPGDYQQSQWATSYLMGYQQPWRLSTLSVTHKQHNTK